MSLHKKILGTGGIQIAGKFFVFVIGVMLARILGPQDYGIYSYLISMVNLFSMLTIAGIPQLLVRELSIYHQNNQFSQIRGILNWSLLYVLVIFIFLIIIIFLFISNVQIEYSYILLLCCCGIALFRALLIRATAILNGFGYSRVAQLPLNIFFPFIFIITIFFAYSFSFERTYESIIKIHFICIFFSFFTGEFLIKKHINKVIQGKKKSVKTKSWQKALIPFTLISFISTMNVELANVFIGIYHIQSEVAFFKIASQGILLLTLGMTAVNTVIAPEVAKKYASGDLLTTQQVLTKGVKYSTLIGVPISVVLLLFSEQIITIVFGTEYLQASVILKILSIGQLFVIVCGSVALTLNMTGHEFSTLKLMGFSAMLNILLLFILVPKYGTVGAAIATMTTSIFWSVSIAYKVFRLTKLKTWVRI